MARKKREASQKLRDAGLLVIVMGIFIPIFNYINYSPESLEFTLSIMISLIFNLPLGLILFIIGIILKKKKKKPTQKFTVHRY